MVVSKVDPKYFALSVDVMVTKSLLYRRFGHPCSRTLDLILKKCNLKVFANDKHTFCEARQFCKVHNLLFLNSISHAASPFELVHTDVWGPTPKLSTDGFRYYILFVDDYSRFTWLFPLKQKGDKIVAFKEFQAFVHI